MKIVFRADASNLIGSGHIMRCMTLASELKKHGHEIFFICKEWEGNLVDYIRVNDCKGYTIPISTLEADLQGDFLGMSELWVNDSSETIDILKIIKPDLLVIDHYSFDIRWEKKVSPFVSKILVIDDLANRQHHCDFLLDQNFFMQKNSRYHGLLSTKTVKLIGSEYALLRDEFISNRKKLLNKPIRNFFVYFGAADIKNETKKVLKALIDISKNYEIIIDVVIGYSNKNKEELHWMCLKYPFIKIHNQTNKISVLMRNSDVSIGAGGSTTWERCCLGLPSIVTTVAENQIIPMEELAKAKAIILMQDPSIEDYKQMSLRVINMTLIEINQMIQNGFQIYDGLGVKRVTKIINEME